MSDTKSFWATLPGILTGIAGVLGATAGLLGILYQLGSINKPTQPPPPSKFRIEEVFLRADPFDYDGPCPVTVRFSGRISVVGGGGTVSYKLVRSDGALAPVQTLHFEAAGSQSVNTTWGPFNASFSGWQAVQTFDPEERVSERATFKLICQTRQSDNSSRSHAEILDFKSEPDVVSAGGSASLCYGVVHARSARIDPEIGELDPKTLNRYCRTVQPKQTTTYMLGAMGLDGVRIDRSVTVRVSTNPPPQVRLEKAAAPNFAGHWVETEPIVGKGPMRLTLDAGWGQG